MIYLVFGCASRGNNTFLLFVLSGQRTPALAGKSIEMAQTRNRKSFKMPKTTSLSAFEGSVLVSEKLLWFLVEEIVVAHLFTQLLSVLFIFTPGLALFVESRQGRNQDKLFLPLSTTPRIVLVM
jgi:hypothetical protein